MAIDTTDADDRHSQMLKQLAAMTFTLARDLSNRALEAENDDDAVKLAAAFHQVSRGLRQTLALEMKVIRFKAELARAANPPPPPKPREETIGGIPAAIWRRKEEIGQVMDRVIWGEAERDEDEPDDFDEESAGRAYNTYGLWLQEAAKRPDFTTADLDDLIIEACQVAGKDPRELYIFDDDEAPEPVSPDSS
ncbi:hypothetical protein [Phenylobacterium sp.]|jgi:hypothetical protein|uniref:hypothetical protein n=1 Tax=Phenylobacterium sp. TaxID=1871053 RepID=UPI002F94889F